VINTNDLKEMNAFLKQLDGKNVTSSIYVDNLHSPFILLENEYLLPSISNMDLTVRDIFPYLKVLASLIPEAIVGCSILPMQKPKRESGKISFVKEISIRGYNYLYVFKIDAAYLGGSPKEKIKVPATQVTHPAIETDRIYFSSRIIPIKNVIRADGEIIDFEIQNFDKGVFFSEVERETDKGDMPRNYSELFDEVDYSNIVEPIKLGLKILHPNWNLGKIYEPVYIEYLTLSIRFLCASFKEIYSHFSHFYEVLEVIHTGGIISDISLRNFIYWLGKHSFDRNISPSGNMRWKILLK